MLTIADAKLQSRMLLGTARYSSPEELRGCIKAANPGFITVSVGRNRVAGQKFFDLIGKMEVPLVPNTAGCRTSKEAVKLAKVSRELLETNWVKLEVIGDDDTLAPDPIELHSAAAELVKEGFVVLAYCSDDLVLCRRLAEAGCHAVMPWGSPIGSGQGVVNPSRLEAIRARLPETVLIVDAGIGRPSDAALAMELGYDGVLLNTAVAQARDPVSMAQAFATCVSAGRAAWKAGIIPRHDLAQPSTLAPDMPFDKMTTRH